MNPEPVGSSLLGFYKHTCNNFLVINLCLSAYTVLYTVYLFLKKVGTGTDLNQDDWKIDNLKKKNYLVVTQSLQTKILEKNHKFFIVTEDGTATA
jgi:hypothetical protein